MSQWDVEGLETHLEGFRRDRYPELSSSDAFERFAVRQILKDADLSDDEIESGLFGGPDDGGVDGMYFFVNRRLIEDADDLPDDALSASLVVIQAKLEAGFSETAVTKIESFSRDLLDHTRDVDGMTHLNSDAREAIRKFRANYRAILGSPHSMTVAYAYATKSDKAVHPKVTKRIDSLRDYVRSQLSDAVVDFHCMGAKELFNAARRTPRITEALDITKQFTTDDGSAVCLVKLGSLAALLRDEHGEVRRSMLEPNVRDYQGVKNNVNKAIRASLEATSTSDFWWLNNGVTILATKCHVAGSQVVIDRPEVVNGLQTSYEIFQFFKTQPEKADARNVLVRVIVPPDEKVRSRIIRATNHQTPINEVSLRATDQIHFEIEDRFKLYGLYYERRKGEYRELKKSADKIIGIQTLARSVIALLLHQPNNAYATPSRVLKANYDGVFGDQLNRDMFVACILLQRQVDKYLSERGSGLASIKSIIRYYVSMAVACCILRKTNGIDDKDLASILPNVNAPIDPRLLESSTQLVMDAYFSHGGTETIAKGPEMLETLVSRLRETVVPK